MKDRSGRRRNRAHKRAYQARGAEFRENVAVRRDAHAITVELTGFIHKAARNIRRMN